MMTTRTPTRSRPTKRKEQRQRAARAVGGGRVVGRRRTRKATKIPLPKIPPKEWSLPGHFKEYLNHAEDMIYQIMKRSGPLSPINYWTGHLIALKYFDPSIPNPVYINSVAQQYYDTILFDTLELFGKVADNVLFREITSFLQLELPDALDQAYDDLVESAVSPPVPPTYVKPEDPTDLEQLKAANAKWEEEERRFARESSHEYRDQQLRIRVLEILGGKDGEALERERRENEEYVAKTQQVLDTIRQSERAMMVAEGETE